MPGGAAAMPKTRVVLDTNVFVSALITPLGTAAAAVAAVWRLYRVVASETTLAELRATLGKPKLARALPAALATAFVESVARRCDLVEPAYDLVRLDDHDDNAFLSLAHAAKARYLVTGDAGFIAARQRLSDLPFAIVTPREFLAVAASESRS